jgi:transposase
MMGERTVAQEALFYEFSLERHVPSDHLLRSIDRFVDLSGIREHLRPFYSETGRPSVDPELMIRMLIIGYTHGIRSERRLCEEVHLNLAYRWFCRLGLDGAVPDHSTFSKNRHGRFRDSDLLRRLFEATSIGRKQPPAAAFCLGHSGRLSRQVSGALVGFPWQDLLPLERDLYSSIEMTCLTSSVLNPIAEGRRTPGKAATS